MKMEDITRGIQQLRLRKGKSVDADLGNSLREDSAGNWRAMGEFMAGFMEKKSDGQPQRQSIPSGSNGSAARSVPQLALMDGTVDESPQPTDAKSEVMAALPKKRLDEEPAGVMGGELEVMRQALAELPMKRPSGKKEDNKKEAKKAASLAELPMKRPSGKKKDMKEVKKAASQKGKKKTAGLKKPAAAKAAASCRRKGMKRPAASSRTDDYRQRLLATVPRALLEKFAKGCSACRYRPYCCNSCWHKRRFHG